MEFELADLKALIKEHEDRFGSVDDLNTLHGRVEYRSKLYALEVPPVLPKPYEQGFRYQSDVLRQKNVKLKARLRENPPRWDCEPTMDTATQRRNAERAALIVNQGIDEVQQREGINLLSALADGISRHCYGVLHWVLAGHIIPDVPEREYLEELPEDRDEAKRYEPHENGYRETAQSQLARHKRSMARAGYPWYVETIPATQFMFTEDRSLANGFAIVIVRREVGLFEYAAKRVTQGKAPLSLHDANPRVPVYGERDAPPDSAPDAGGFGKKVKLYQVWTRTEFYELVEYGASAEIADAFEHCYGMPPFAVAYGNVNENETSLVRRYEPALEGIYRVKPAFDYWMSLYYTMAESNAMPLYVLESTTDGMPMLADDGTPLTMTRNAAMSMKLPEGYKLVPYSNEISPAFARLGEWILQELEAAYPSAGDAEVSASTQPWAIRLQQAMANVEPAMYLSNIAKALDVMVTNQARVMSMPEEFPNGVAVYARIKDGKVNKRDIVSLEPHEIESLDFSTTISPTSAAEQITKEQFGMEKLKSKLITIPEYIRDFEGRENAEELYVQRQSWWYFADKIQPAILQQESKAHFGAHVVMDPTTGGFLGEGGMPMSSADVLTANGQVPTTMPDLSQMQAPGTLPLQGVPG